MDSLSDEHGYELEQNFVRSTYEKIAQEFSSTRYKKWPKVENFLQTLEEGSLLLDVGCGNGKYLDNKISWNIGCDLSLNLLKICRQKQYEVVLCDMSRLPFRADIFDNVICIAALHHLTTSNRRKKCLSDMIDIISPHSKGQCLVQVWSFEQELDKNNPYLKRQSIKPSGSTSCFTNTELEVGDQKISLPIHKNRTPFASQDVLVPFHTKSDPRHRDEVQQQLRYYHIFKEGELEALFLAINGVVLEQSYYDRGNWCVVARRVVVDDARIGEWRKNCQGEKA